MQKYNVYYHINNNNSIDNPTIKKTFFDNTKKSLILNLTDLSRIRNNITNKYKNVYLKNLILALKNINLDIEYYSTDVKYQYKEKSNKFIERK